MMKQIEMNGKTFEAFSWDGGKSWSSDPKATLTFLRRRKAILETRLSEAELRWIDLLNREPDDPADLDAIRAAVKFG